MANLTPAEVNEELALLKGWVKENVIRHEGGKSGYIWCSPKGDSTIGPPDFCGDWQHAGPLLEELLRKSAVDLGQIRGELARIETSNFLSINKYGLKEAIARASLAWKQSRKQDIAGTMPQKPEGEIQ